MKTKTLKKRIRRLETRLQEDSRKLAKLKRKFEAQVKADAAKAKKKSAARAAAKMAASASSAPVKVKRKLNLSPERRAQLSAAMKARWAAIRAASAPNPPKVSTTEYQTL